MVDQFLPAFRANEESAIAAQFFLHEGVECVRILKGGDSRSVPVFRAADVWDRGDFGETLTYADRFENQYKQFKQGSTQTANGTPLESAPFLNPSRISDLRALKVFSLEGLASFDDRYISRLGGNGYNLKEQAQEFLAKKRATPDTSMLSQENEALREEMARMQAQLASLQQMAPIQTGDGYEGRSTEELREEIKAITGKYPAGQPGRDFLIRSLNELKNAQAA